MIRGGWGVFYDVPALNFFVANTGLPNGGAAGINANPGGPNPVYTITARNVVFQPGVPVFGSAGPVPPFGAFGISQDFRTPYVQNFNLNIQRQLSSTTILQAGYVGSLGRKLPVLRDINQPINGVRPYATQYPTLATIDTVFSMTNSDYNSLQAQLRQSLWKGLAATFNYTLRPRHRQHQRCAQHRPDQQLRPEERARQQHLRYPPHRDQLRELPASRFQVRAAS